MASEEHPGREDVDRQLKAERLVERSALGPLSGRDGEEDEYTGPDPERADDPPVPEEDQGV